MNRPNLMKTKSKYNNTTNNRLALYITKEILSKASKQSSTSLQALT